MDQAALRALYDKAFSHKSSPANIAHQMLGHGIGQQNPILPTTNSPIPTNLRTADHHLPWRLLARRRHDDLIQDQSLCAPSPQMTTEWLGSSDLRSRPRSTQWVSPTNQPCRNTSPVTKEWFIFWKLGERSTRHFGKTYFNS